MPQWIHNRARHIQAKNPDMSESKAFAIATQQAHSVGKSPKGYGTEEGRREAKAKYDSPEDDKKTADPNGIGREFEKNSSEGAQVMYLTPFLDGFADELEKIAGLGSWAKGRAGKAVVEGIVKNPENRQAAEKFVRDAAWSGVKDGIKRNAGKMGLLGGAAGVGAMAMHQHGKAKRQRDREQLLQDLALRIKPAKASKTKVANLATTVTDIKSTIPRNTMKVSTPKYSKVNVTSIGGQAQMHQPVLSPPPVRG